jgi:deoxyhypusine synthase
MDMPVVNVVQGELISTETDIALIVEPYLRRTVVLDKNPLSDVKLFSLHQQRVLNVLLDDELYTSSQTIISDIVDVVEASDSSSS